jgi:hypothetical protein
MSDVQIDSRRVETSVVLKDGTAVKIVTVKRRAPYSTPYATVREWNKGTRIYVDEVGETVLDNLEKRMGRPSDKYKAPVLEALEQIGLTSVKVNWSQRAGCTCPCSPGFILRNEKGVMRYFAADGYTPVDISIQITAGSLGESASRNIFTEEKAS